MADRIVVLEKGKIAEDGNHDELSGLGGRYAEMFELQAASYR
jgi:ATP-binding cassette subfamily B protein